MLLVAYLLKYTSYSLHHCCKFQTIDMVDESLRNLQLDYVDSVLIHFPGLPVEFDPMKTDKPDPVFYSACITSKKPERAPEARMAMWTALQKCVKAGKVRHIGVSNFNRDHIEKMVNDPRFVAC